MNKIDVKKRIEKLRDEIKRKRYEYHVTNNPLVTDDVYESLTRELNDLISKNPEFDDPNSSLNRVAGEPLPFFGKVKHPSRMLSLNDAFGKDDVIDWEKELKEILEIKIKIIFVN